VRAVRPYWGTPDIASPSDLLAELLGIPDTLGNLGVQRLAGVEISSMKVLVGPERQARALDRLEEAGIVLVAMSVQRPGEQVLAIIVPRFLLIRQCTIAGVEALR
jgi:hypothetical protein